MPNPNQTDKSDELKPCPFCGPLLGSREAPDGQIREYPWIPVDPTQPMRFCISCENCGCGQNAETEEAAPEKWNTRPVESALQQQIDKQNKRLEVAQKLVDALEWLDAAEEVRESMNADELIADTLTEWKELANNQEKIL